MNRALDQAERGNAVRIEAAVQEMLTALVRQVAGLPQTQVRVAIRQPLSIQSNRLYDVRAGHQHLILKEYLKEPEFEDAPRREFAALQLLEPLDIAPHPLYRQPPKSPLGPIVLYEYLEGTMWDRRQPSAQELTQLADLWLQINSLPTEGLWMSRGYERSLTDTLARFHTTFCAYRDWVEAAYPLARRPASLCLDLLEKCRPVVRELASIEPLLCFCRSDPRFANVIARPDGRLGLVDWEDSGLRDPARDLADILLHPNQEDLLEENDWWAFTEPYTAGCAETDPGMADRAHYYELLFHVFWLAALIRSGLERARTGRLMGWQVHEMTANQRLRRYLARGIAWPKADFAAELESLNKTAFFPGHAQTYSAID